MTELARSLTRLHATAMVAGTIIGASIFVQPSEIARHLDTPLSIMAAWIACGVLTLFGALVCAELASAFRRPEWTTSSPAATTRTEIGSIPLMLETIESWMWTTSRGERFSGRTPGGYLDCPLTLSDPPDHLGDRRGFALHQEPGPEDPAGCPDRRHRGEDHERHRKQHLPEGRARL